MHANSSVWSRPTYKVNLNSPLPRLRTWTQRGIWALVSLLLEPLNVLTWYLFTAETDNPPNRRHCLSYPLVLPEPAYSIFQISHPTSTNHSERDMWWAGPQLHSTMIYASSPWFFFFMTESHLAWTHNPAASISWLLGLKACMQLFKYIYWHSPLWISHIYIAVFLYLIFIWQCRSTQYYKAFLWFTKWYTPA